MEERDIISPNSMTETLGKLPYIWVSPFPDL